MTPSVPPSGGLSGGRIAQLPLLRDVDCCRNNGNELRYCWRCDLYCRCDLYNYISNAWIFGIIGEGCWNNWHGMSNNGWTFYSDLAYVESHYLSKLYLKICSQIINIVYNFDIKKYWKGKVL